MTDLGNSLKEKNLGHIADISNEFIREKKEPERIIELAKETTKFFKDQFGKGCALVKINDHYESIPLESNRFKWYLTKLFYDHNFGIPAGKENINSAIQYLQSIAEFESPTNTLHIRVAKYEDSIYYDLTDENWNCVKIDRNGWQVIKPDFPLFRRYSQTAQPTPNKEYNGDILDRFMNLTNIKNKDDLLLVKVWIIMTVIPEIEHTILNFHGGQDAGKTTTQRLIKTAIDPDRPEHLLSINPDKMEFIQQLSQRHIAFYDNLKYKINWLAEEVCKAVTGAGTTKRELYTNEGNIIFDYRICIGFNGINMIMNEPDVLRRSLIIEQKTIEEGDKISETKLRMILDELKSKLLGYIFDIVSKAIGIKNSIELDKVPGMTDFAIWGEAISRIMGYPEMEFIDAYRRNIQRQNEHVIETNPFAKSISLLYNDLHEDSNIECRFSWNEELQTWSISASGFIEELKGVAMRNGIDINDKRFPYATNKLSNQLNIIKSNLRSNGIGIVLRSSRTKEDVENGFNKNTMIVDMKTIRSTLPPYYLEGAYPVRVDLGKDSKYCNDSLGTLELKMNTGKSIEKESSKEHTESILTIPTIPTNHIQCPKCNHHDIPFHMRVHMERCKS
jgi:hypothetical protein